LALVDEEPAEAEAVVEELEETREEAPTLLVARLPAVGDRKLPQVVGNAGTELVLLFFEEDPELYLSTMRLRPISWDWTEAKSWASVASKKRRASSLGSLSAFVSVCLYLRFTVVGLPFHSASASAAIAHGGLRG
jgi:hypothetical protein